MIKYVLWDIDGTLLDFDLAETRSIKFGFEKFNLGTCSEKMLDDYKKINDKYWKALERKEISKREVLEGRFVEFFEKYGIDPKISEDFNYTFQRSLARFSDFNPHAKDMVSYLKKSYRQFGATNGTKVSQEGKLKKSGLDKDLEKVFISEELGFDKPSVEFFDHIFSYTEDFNKDSYVIIGDSLTSDIKGGVDSFIKTIWYNPEKKEKTIDIRTDFEIFSLKEIKNIL